MDLALVRNDVLRKAIRENLVSFPSQVPAFTQHEDIRERIVQLYFVRGWELKAICERLRLSRSTVRKLLTDWKTRAVGAGYIQEINPEGLDALERDKRFREPEDSEYSKSDDSDYLMRVPPHSEYFSSPVAVPARGLRPILH